MVLADMTIWTQVLRGQSAGLQSLFRDLLFRREITAPGLVFAQLLAEAEDDRAAERIRGWATEVRPIEEPPLAWLAAGDLAAHFAQHNVPMSLIDVYLVGLAVREGWALWSFNPALERATRVLPFERYVPTGIS